MPSFKTIYRWIDEKYLHSTQKICAEKGNRGNAWETAEDSHTVVSGKAKHALPRLRKEKQNII